MDNFDNIFDSSRSKQTSNEDFDREVWGQQKQAERDNVYAMLDERTAELGCSPDAMRTYLDVQSRFMNMSVSNALLIAAQCPDAAKVATFDDWHRENASILSGEKAISILTQGSSFTRDDGTEGRYTNVAKVFDISQTSANNGATPQTAPPVYAAVDLMKGLSTHAPASIEMSDSLPDGRNAYYQPENNTVYVRRGLDANSLFSALTNELAMATLCKDGSAPRENGAAAYAASYILCKKYGMDTRGFSVEKLSGAMGSLDEKGIRAELVKARNAAYTVSRQIDRTLNPQQRSDKAPGAR